MKAKYLAIYAVVGAAFLAVSLWVFLSGGKNARAIRYKYKLGGIILMAWSMLSVASCEGTPLTVSCYDPAPSTYASIETKDDSKDFKAGDVLAIHIWDVHYEKYTINIHALDEENTLLQSTTFAPADPSLDEQHFDLTLDAFDYKGRAVVSVSAFIEVSEGQSVERVLSDFIGINLL